MRIYKLLLGGISLLIIAGVMAYGIKSKADEEIYGTEPISAIVHTTVHFDGGKTSIGKYTVSLSNSPEKYQIEAIYYLNERMVKWGGLVAYMENVDNSIIFIPSHNIDYVELDYIEEK